MDVRVTYEELIDRHVRKHLLLPLLEKMTEEGTRDDIWEADLEMLLEGKYDALVLMISAKLESLGE